MSRPGRFIPAQPTCRRSTRAATGAARRRSAPDRLRGPPHVQAGRGPQVPKGAGRPSSFRPGPGDRFPGPAYRGRSTKGPDNRVFWPSALSLFFKGTNGNLWHVFRVGGGSWSAPGSLGMGVLGSGPWATAQPSGAIDVFWRGSSGSHLWRAAYRPGTGWSGPGDLGGDLYPVS